MNSYTKFEENRSINAQDRARKRNADGRTDRRIDGRTDGQTDRRTDGHSNANFFGGYNIIPRTFFKWRGIKIRFPHDAAHFLLSIETIVTISICILLWSSSIHTVHTARQIPTGTSNSRCLCQRVRFGG